jgi:hypothetical protein
LKYFALDRCAGMGQSHVMPKRSSKPRDINQLAKSIVDQATGNALPPVNDGKNPAAVALGKLGGAKGGKARAKALSPAKRRAIAKKAAVKRWSAS